MPVARVVQLTDLHLFTEPERTLKEVCTRQTLQRVLDVLPRSPDAVDHLVVTGDIAHDELLETYCRLSPLLGDWRARLRLLPGNHDNRDAMQEVFPDRIQRMGERIVFEEFAGAWRLLGLDTHIPGSVNGLLGAEQLDWIDSRLRADTRPTCLFMHHPPVGTGSHWLNLLGLGDAEALRELIIRHAVRLVCCGHGHQEMTVGFGGCTVLMSASTGVQFRPNNYDFDTDPLAPGYRLLELEPDGGFRTRVIRVTADAEA